LKTVVCIVVYNRIENILKWLAAWEKWPQENAELRIIHNVDNANAVTESTFKTLVENSGAAYIRRRGVGMDIGALQDVAQNRLPGFADGFDFLFWATDDALPMRETWLSEFLDVMKSPGVGASCMELSPEVRQHMRTTGFLIRAEILPTLNFLADPVSSKEHCWAFEHKSASNLFFQMIAKGLACVQVAHLSISPMWDSGHARHPSRAAEFYKEFPEFAPLPDKVLVICPAYERYPVQVHSMIAQTFKSWEMHVVYNGPMPKGWAASIKDSRVSVTATKEYKDKTWGHHIRAEYLEKAKTKEIGADCSHVLITNEDNYHMPKFLEKMLAAFKPETVAAYSGDMVHSYRDYGLIASRPELGFIDCASVIIRKEHATAAGWRSMEHSSDWQYFSDVAAQAGGFGKWVRVPGCHFVHN